MRHSVTFADHHLKEVILYVVRHIGIGKHRFGSPLYSRQRCAKLMGYGSNKFSSGLVKLKAFGYGMEYSDITAVGTV